MQDLASTEHAKVLTLQQENEQLRAQKDQYEVMKAEFQRLQGLEPEADHFRRMDVNPRDLETFVANKTAIRHYLKLVPMLLEYVIYSTLYSSDHLQPAVKTRRCGSDSQSLASQCH